MLLALVAGTTSAVLASDGPASAEGARPWLGIAMDMDAQGVRVGHVVRGSPAGIAGVHEGDHIRRVGGAVIAKAGDVSQTVSTLHVGDRVPVEVARADGPHTLSAVLAAFPSQDQMMRMDLVGAPAPAWSDTHAVSGAFPASIAALKGRVVLLDFWATWCGPCRVVAPMLDGLNDLHGAQGLSVVGISTEDAGDVGTFAQRMGLHYGIGDDPHGRTTRAYGVVSLPTLVIIDKRGIVREVTVGYDPDANRRLDATVQALLAEPDAAPTP